MMARASKFPWSDQQIRDAIAPRGIPDPAVEEILRGLAEVGARHILARRKGGQRPKEGATRGQIRRILVSAIFDGSLSPGLPPRLRKVPTSPVTVKKVREILGQCGHIVSDATVLNDIKRIGPRSLRGQ
jgi:hypothetical protein